jgi:phosphate transport system protein
VVRRFLAPPPEPEPEPAASEEAKLIDRQVIQLFALVEEAVAGATHALLTGDRAAAQRLMAKDAELDALYRQLEDEVQAQVVTGGHSAGRTRWYLALLSMLPELERSGDLAEHVAQRAIRSLPAEMPARVRGFIEKMGEIACSMWNMAADAYADRVEGSEEVDQLDDQLDDLHVELIAEIAGGSVPVPVAIELALVGRFYERLGDHAVNIARRVPTQLRSEAIGD